MISYINNCITTLWEPIGVKPPKSRLPIGRLYPILYSHWTRTSGRQIVPEKGSKSFLRHRRTTLVEKNTDDGGMVYVFYLQKAKVEIESTFFNERFTGKHSILFVLILYSSDKGSSKKKIPPLMAGPLRGGGVKAGPLRKKELFLKLFFLFCCHLKIKIILLQTTYRNMDISR